MVQSLTERQRGELYVVAGFVLLLNPFVVGMFDVGDPDSYRYEPEAVTFYDNGTYDGPDPNERIDPEVACFGDSRPFSRECAIERAVHANGGIAYDGIPGSFVDSEYEYVHVWEEGFFEPVTEHPENGSVVYGLEPVAQSEALDAIATDSDDASRGVRTALETGTFRTSDPIDGANELVAHDGSYYVVTAHASRVRGTERRDVVVFLQWVLGVGGGWLVLRGQRLRVAGTG